MIPQRETAFLGALFRDHCSVRKGQAYHYPLVLKYLVDTVTQDGGSRTQEITPWAYKRLEWRAKQGACQNTI